MDDLDSKSDLDMTEVWPPVPSATRKAPAAEPGAGATGMRKATPRHRRSPPGVPISTASTVAELGTTDRQEGALLKSVTARDITRPRALRRAPVCKVPPVKGARVERHQSNSRRRLA